MTRPAPAALLEGLIASKLSPPVRDARAISHGDVVRRAVDGLPDSRLIAIVAPAGSGKSSLMTELLGACSERGIAVTWLGLDAEENDPATFARYFISAVQGLSPGFADDELIALGANPVRDFDSLFDRLGSRLGGLTLPAAIFIDDFQHLVAASILRFVDRLLAHLPRQLSLIIASRHRLPLQLGRLLVAGQLIEVGQDELNFDRSQTEQFLQRYHQLELSATDIDTLLHSTEGWPTGVQLAALALRRHQGDAADLLKTFSGRDRDLTRYLVESVIRAQPAQVRDFLLRSSPLRRMNAALCAATTGAADSRRMLDDIGRANLFLIALDREGQWHRYHHLFAEFLQHEFRSTDPDGYRAACRQAATWCAAHDQPGEAIRYALDGSHFEQAAELIAGHAIRASLFRGDHYTVLDWLRVLPAEFHAQRPEILLSHAWASAFSRDTRRAMAVSQQAIDILSGPALTPWNLGEDARARWLLWAQTVQAATKACSDDIDDCVERATTLLPKVPPSEPFLIATLSNCLSYGYFARRDFDRSHQHALAAHAHGHRADSAYLSAWGDFLHGLIDVERGELHAASRIGQHLHRDSQGLGLGQRSYVAGLSAVLDAEIAVQRCDYEQAALHIDASRAFKEIFGPVEPQLVAVRCEARLQAQRQRIDLATQLLQEGQDSALREQHRRLYLALALEETALQLTAGDIGAAAAITRRTRLLDAGDDLPRAQRDALKLIDARFRLACGDTRAAVRLLTGLQQARGAEAHGGFALSVSTHRAVGLWELGQHQEAARQLDRALNAAASEFHAYPIAAAGRALLPILDAIDGRRRDAATQDLRPLLHLQGWLRTQLQGNSRQDPAEITVERSLPGDGIEALTSREIELLRLLHAGLSNQTLADTLLVSVSTIKWHLHNVYEKLGVGSRGAAVATAIRLGLI
ncbi:MAG: LuxR C-terminal-related transcriptional regulator [Nevskia sp.]|uniref:LuxR C-terminal-related transcriptional regulator n=1 Tax=Nevskia sp. TaxID=1929292 RepID=UPI004035EFDB